MPANIPSLDVDAWADDLDTLLDAAAAFAVATLRYANAPHILTRQEADLSRERLGDLKRRYTARLTALASALPGMGKADALVRSLAAGRCRAGYHGAQWAADSCLGMHDWALTDPPRLGEPLRSKLRSGDDMCTRCQALKIVRAAQPEETSATRCVICQKDGDYDEMVATYDGEPAHRSCRATVEPWRTATDGFCSTCGNPKHWQSLSPRCVGFHTPRAWVRLA